MCVYIQASDGQAQTEYVGAEFRRKPVDFQVECIGLRQNVNTLFNSYYVSIIKTLAKNAKN